MIQTVPVLTKAIGAILLAGYMLVSAAINLINPTSSPITSWDGYNKYQTIIDNKKITIYLLEEESNSSKLGKIKIVFKDDKSKGTTIIFERELGGELTQQDQQYVERILSDIENFHKENRTYNQIKSKLDSFWKGLKRNGK